jgi:hypothetical protein
LEIGIEALRGTASRLFEALDPVRGRLQLNWIDSINNKIASKTNGGQEASMAQLLAKY